MKKMEFFKATALVSAIALLSACGAIDESTNEDDHDHDSEAQSESVNLPDGKTLVFINSTTAQQYQYNTTTEKFEDLNEHASTSTDAAEKKLQLTDSATIGQFFVWSDNKGVEGGEVEDKLVLLKPGVTLTSDIDSTNLQYLAHFHGEDLAAHSADEFASATCGTPEVCTKKQAGLARLNTSYDKYAELFNEVKEALEKTDASQQLCRAYIDPHAGEEEHSHDAKSATDSEEHHEKVHYALTKSGTMFFFVEEEGKEGLSVIDSTPAQSPVELDGVSTISNCDHTGIARASDEGVLVYVPDNNHIYYVDHHEPKPFHVHQEWDVTKLMPAGFTPDMMAAIGKGNSDHDDHEGHDH